jgi:hypothetical protein
VRLLHEPTEVRALLDDPNLVSRTGVVPVMALAQRAGLAELAAGHVRLARLCGGECPGEGPRHRGCVIAGADSIDHLGVLRHGVMPGLFGGMRAPSTLGSFLRSFTWGNEL